MVRTLFGTFSGAVVAALVLVGCWYGVAHVHPLPTPDGLAIPDPLESQVAAIPYSVMACILAAWALAGLLGGGTATLLSRTHRGAAALAVGGLLTASVIVYGTLVPKPEWMVVGVLLPIPFAAIGALLAMPRNEI